MKILNLYAGIGGNRAQWGGEHDITAVEFDPKIADAYRQLWPEDTVIVGDAHQYLLDHHAEFDFIWSSPPLPDAYAHAVAPRQGVRGCAEVPVWPAVRGGRLLGELV